MRRSYYQVRVFHILIIIATICFHSGISNAQYFWEYYPQVLLDDFEYGTEGALAGDINLPTTPTGAADASRYNMSEICDFLVCVPGQLITSYYSDTHPNMPTRSLRFNIMGTGFSQQLIHHVYYYPATRFVSPPFDVSPAFDYGKYVVLMWKSHIETYMGPPIPNSSWSI